MAIVVECKTCARKYRAKDEFVGRSVNCPACQQSVVIDGERVPNHDVFISYSSKDKKIADAICAEVEKQRVRCWIAPRDVELGITFGSAIINAINDSRVMVLIVSGNANLSRHVLREVERAFAKGVEILPVRIEDVVMSRDFEYFLSASQWLDAMTPPMEEHLQRLTKRIKHLLSPDPSNSGQLPTPTRDGTAPPRPQISRSEPAIGLLSELKRQCARRPSLFGAAVIAGVVGLIGFVALAVSFIIPNSEQGNLGPQSELIRNNDNSDSDAALARSGDMNNEHPSAAAQHGAQPNVEQNQPPPGAPPALPYFEERPVSFVAADRQAQEAAKQDRLKLLQGLKQFELVTVLEMMAATVSEPRPGYDGTSFDQTNPNIGRPSFERSMPFDQDLNNRQFSSRPRGGSRSVGFDEVRRQRPASGEDSRSDETAFADDEEVSDFDGKLPKRFILTGFFIDSRVAEGKTWVWLAPSLDADVTALSMAPYGGDSQRQTVNQFQVHNYDPRSRGVANPYDPTGRLSRRKTYGPKSALILFDGEQIADALCDFAEDVQVSVVVERAKATVGSATHMQRVPGVDPHRLRECSVFSFPTDMDSQLANERWPDGRPELLVWIARGIAIEKRLRSETWANLETGVMRQLEDRDQALRSPTIMIRYPGALMGVEGRIKGRLQNITQATTQPWNLPPHASITGLKAQVKIDVGEKRTMLLDVTFGSKVRASDLGDYSDQQPIEAGVRLVDLVTGSTYAPPIPLPTGVAQSTGLSWNRLKDSAVFPLIPVRMQMQCDWIQKEGDDYSRITAEGRLRPPRDLPETLTPELASANPELAKGKKIEWTGVIQRIMRSTTTGRTHILVKTPARLTGFEPTVEAFADAKGFIDELDDYPADSEKRISKNAVVIKGTIVGADVAKPLLNKNAIQVRLEQISRPDDPTSAAIPGKKRPKKSFAADSTIPPFVKLMRALPPVGTELSFRAEYSSFRTSNDKQSVQLSEEAQDYSASVAVTFPAASESDFSDYQYDQPVEVVARVGPVDDQTRPPQNELIGVSIKRPGNRFSEVTDKGRSQPPRKFTKEKEIWNEIKNGRDDSNGRSVKLVGSFDSYSTEDEYVTIKVERLFHEHESIDVICDQAMDVALNAVQRLNKGDEIVFQVTAWKKDYSQAYHLYSLARFDEPETILLGERK
jgi:hypothetical protein